MPEAPPRLRALPLATWERDGVRAALVGAGLPADDVGEASLLFWRFETDDVPVGFGGLRLHGRDAELCAVLTLPPLRHGGLGRAIVADLETEAALHKCRAIYLATKTEAEFFSHVGYAPCVAADVPETIRTSAQFKALVCAGAAVMRKPLPDAAGAA
jgi:N-acetylglutamate synthase-like GNAT family acetyltransferase